MLSSATHVDRVHIIHSYLIILTIIFINNQLKLILGITAARNHILYSDRWLIFTQHNKCMSSSPTALNNKTGNKTHIIAVEIKENTITFRFHIIFNVQVKKKKKKNLTKQVLYIFAKFCKIK